MPMGWKTKNRGKLSLPQGAVIEQLIDLRKVVDILAKRGVDDKTLRSVAYENYARCLRNAMLGRASS